MFPLLVLFSLITSTQGKEEIVIDSCLIRGYGLEAWSEVATINKASEFLGQLGIQLNMVKVIDEEDFVNTTNGYDMCFFIQSMNDNRSCIYPRDEIENVARTTFYRENNYCVIFNSSDTYTMAIPGRACDWQKNGNIASIQLVDDSDSNMAGTLITNMAVWLLDLVYRSLDDENQFFQHPLDVENGWMQHNGQNVENITEFLVDLISTDEHGYYSCITFSDDGEDDIVYDAIPVILDVVDVPNVLEGPAKLEDVVAVDVAEVKEESHPYGVLGGFVVSSVFVLVFSIVIVIFRKRLLYCKVEDDNNAFNPSDDIEKMNKEKNDSNEVKYLPEIDDINSSTDTSNDSYQSNESFRGTKV